MHGRKLGALFLTVYFKQIKKNTMSDKNIVLTSNQLEAVNKVKEFGQSNNDIFILTGAAGTGKTTVVKNIIDKLNSVADMVILLAPTNRAAKVLSIKTGILTNTVHSEIYTLEDLFLYSFMHIIKSNCFSKLYTSEILRSCYMKIL